jgi:hypothetical protein
MRKHMPSLPVNLVNEYIKRARKAARSPSEREAVAEASILTAEKGKGRPRPRVLSLGMLGDQLDDLFWTGRISLGTISRETREVLSWKDAILREIHIALCRGSRKYAKEVATLKSNGRLLIGAIAGYVAASIGVSVVVTAALVATCLHVVLKVGVSAFCERYRSLFSK